MTTVMVSPFSCLMALVTSSLVSSTAMDSSTGISQAWIVALTWPRAMPTDTGSAASVTLRFCSTVGRSGFCGAHGAVGPAGGVSGCSMIGRVGAMVFICFLTRLCEPVRQSASHSARPAPGGRAQPTETLDLAVATQMLMQVAVRDIGQVTDI